MATPNELPTPRRTRHQRALRKCVAFYRGTGWRASETWFYAYVMVWDRIAVYDGGWFERSQDPISNPIEVGEPEDEAAA